MSIKKITIPPFAFIMMISILGYIIGVISIALWQDNWLLQMEVLDLETIYKIHDISLDKRALFFLCLGKRLRAFFVLIFMSFTPVKFVYLFLFFGIHGFATGSIIELLLIQYGIQGGWLYVFYVLPQGLLYTLGYFITGCWCFGIAKNKARSEKVRIIMAFILILLGIMAESWLNEKNFLMFFCV